jgi:hypothetical protein
VLRSSNPITNLTVPHNAAAEYPLLIENNGDLEPKITLKATLTRNGSGRSPGTGRITFKPPLTSIDASERRRVVVKLPKLSQGTYTLSISASIPKQSGGDKAEVIATKTVTVNALPKPRQHGL